MAIKREVGGRVPDGLSESLNTKVHELHMNHEAFVQLVRRDLEDIVGFDKALQATVSTIANVTDRVDHRVVQAFMERNSDAVSLINRKIETLDDLVQAGYLMCRIECRIPIWINADYHALKKMTNTDRKREVRRQKKHTATGHSCRESDDENYDSDFTTLRVDDKSSLYRAKNGYTLYIEEHGLTDREVSVLELSVYFNMKQDEIANELGMTNYNVKKLLESGKAKSKRQYPAEKNGSR